MFSTTVIVPTFISYDFSTYVHAAQHGTIIKCEPSHFFTFPTGPRTRMENAFARNNQKLQVWSENTGCQRPSIS